MATQDAPDTHSPEPPGVDETVTEQVSIGHDVKNAGCGFLMGAADIVPGVSGGTMALIVGVYERLVTAISHFDRTFIGQVRSGSVRDAARHVDLRFLAALGCGIVVGAGGLASIMKHLLIEHRSVTYAAFTGMILASSLLVARQIQTWQPRKVVLLVLAAAAAWWIVTLSALQNPPDSLIYLFVCGMIGICAMILPGISGAFILLLMSRYETVLNAIRSFVHMEITVDVLATLLVFSAGCATGLLAFSKVLRKLLATHHDSTVAVMCGFMLGSLYKLWPFQHDLTPEVEDLKHKTFEHFMPSGMSSDVLIAGLAVVVAVVLVLALDAIANRLSRNDHND